MGEVLPEGAQLQHKPDASNILPVFIGQLYDVYNALLFGKDYALLVAKKREPPSASQMEKHVMMARSALKPDIVVVLPALPSYERNRLVQRGIPFIVPYRQIYLPMVLVDFREKARRGTIASVNVSDELSAPAHAVVLLYLQRYETASWSLAQWADKLRYSRMTLSRVRRELEEFGLCEDVGQARAVVLGFTTDRRALWKKIEPHLRSPVRGCAYARILNPDKLSLVKGGLSALAQQTSIGDPQHPVFAMSLSAYQTALAEGKLQQLPHADENSVMIEKWRYAPNIICGDKELADPLSVYLSLRENPDERIQQALVDLLEDVRWQ